MKEKKETIHQRNCSHKKCGCVNMPSVYYSCVECEKTVCDNCMETNFCCHKTMISSSRIRLP